MKKKKKGTGIVVAAGKDYIKITRKNVVTKIPVNTREALLDSLMENIDFADAILKIIKRQINISPLELKAIEQKLKEAKQDVEKEKAI